MEGEGKKANSEDVCEMDLWLHKVNMCLLEALQS